MHVRVFDGSAYTNPLISSDKMQRVPEFFLVGTYVMTEYRFALPEGYLVQFRRGGTNERILVLMQEVQGSEDWLGFAREYAQSPHRIEEASVRLATAARGDPLPEPGPKRSPMLTSNAATTGGTAAAPFKTPPPKIQGIRPPILTLSGPPPPPARSLPAQIPPPPREPSIAKQMPAYPIIPPPKVKAPPPGYESDQQLYFLTPLDGGTSPGPSRASIGNESTNNTHVGGWAANISVHQLSVTHPFAPPPYWVAGNEVVRYVGARSFTWNGTTWQLRSGGHGL